MEFAVSRMKVSHVRKCAISVLLYLYILNMNCRENELGLYQLGPLTLAQMPSSDVRNVLRIVLLCVCTLLIHHKSGLFGNLYK